jgi:hypothetical protein
MKVVRRITYEVPDTPEGEAKLRRQMEYSVPAGSYPWQTQVTVEHVEGPQFPEDGQRSNAPVDRRVE